MRYPQSLERVPWPNEQNFLEPYPVNSSILHMTAPFPARARLRWAAPTPARGRPVQQGGAPDGCLHSSSRGKPARAPPKQQVSRVSSPPDGVWKSPCCLGPTSAPHGLGRCLGPTSAPHGLGHLDKASPIGPVQDSADIPWACGKVGVIEGNIIVER